MSKKKLGLMLAFAVVIGACGSSAASKATEKKAPEASSSTTGASTDPTSTTLQLVDTTLGKVVADSDGKVLYLYVPDGASTESKVPAGLLAAWPPVKATGVPTLGPGLTAKSSTGAQPNGEKWVMYNGHLLYGFSGDAKAGDVNGNAVGNIWYAVTAAGGPVQS